MATPSSDERFRLIVESVKDYAIFMLDPEGRVQTWNTGARLLKGYEAHEIIGQHFSRFYPPEASKDFPAYELRVAAKEGRFEDEGWRVRKDGTRFWANVIITALFDPERRLVGYAKVTRDLTELRGFAKLTRDLTERKRTEALEATGAEREAMLEAERNARMLAQRTARMKDEFLATLSHELRTPLNAILGWTQLLRVRGAPDPEEFRRGIEVIERNARAQVRLIDDLLDLSRIMSGRFRLDVQQVALLDIVRSALDSIEPTAQTKGVRLESILDPQSIIVAGDPARLQQVFWNLLSNAVKFTPKGGGGCRRCCSA